MILVLYVWVAFGCADLTGSWYDDTIDDLVELRGLAENNEACLFESDYGRAVKRGSSISPVGGLLHTLGIVAEISDDFQSLKWSNGMIWTRQTISKDPEGVIPEVSIQLARVMGKAINPSLRAGKCMNTTDPARGPQSYEPRGRFVSLLPSSDCELPPSADAKDITHSSVYEGCVYSEGLNGKSVTLMLGDQLIVRNAKGILPQDLWQFNTQEAYEKCDFSDAQLMVSALDMVSLSLSNISWTWEATSPGITYWGSSTSGENGPDQKENCWIESDLSEKPRLFGQSTDAWKAWGKGMKFEVHSIDPKKMEFIPCPGYKTVQSKDSLAAKTQEVLGGSVAAIARQLISLETSLQERVRQQGNSGLTVVRSYSSGPNAYHTGNYIESSPAAIHNHANEPFTLGMGEFGAVLNGVQFMAHHTDYQLSTPVNENTQVYHDSKIPPLTSLDTPEVPPEVTSLPPEDQAAEMREWFKAFKTQNITLRNYKPYFKANLCYLEGAWLNLTHHVNHDGIDTETWDELRDKNNFFFMSGQKANNENVPFLPNSFRDMFEAHNIHESAFSPKPSQYFFRIACIPLDEDVPLERLRQRSDSNAQIRFSMSSLQHLSSSTQALFDLNPSKPDDYSPGRWTSSEMTGPEFLDFLMAKIPGFEGPQGDMRDDAFGQHCIDALNVKKVPLNTAYYSRYYSISTADASGRNKKRRSFNDNLFAAQTDHPSVTRFSVCTELDNDIIKADENKEDLKRQNEVCFAKKTYEECKAESWGPSSTGSAYKSMCYWNSRNICVYKKCWKQAWTYALPLEIVYTTPLTKWNPYNIPVFSKADSFLATESGRDGSKNKPWKGATQHDKYYITPSEFFGETDSQEHDPASSSTGSKYVEDGQGITRQVHASGQWIILPSITGVGSVRQRYPIFPIHEEGSTIFKEVKGLQDIVFASARPKSAQMDKIREMMEENRKTKL